MSTDKMLTSFALALTVVSSSCRDRIECTELNKMLSAAGLCTGYTVVDSGSMREARVLKSTIGGESSNSRERREGERRRSLFYKRTWPKDARI